MPANAVKPEDDMKMMPENWTMDTPFFEGPSSDDEEDQSEQPETACALVHSPGFGIVGTGCGRGLVGSKTLERHVAVLEQHGKTIRDLEPKMHLFKYGNA